MSIRCLIAALARLRKQGDLHFVFDTYPARTCSRRKTCPRQRPVSSLDAGLALMPVQHVAPENWSPSQALGTRNGKNAAKHAQQIGFPEGVNVWLDLEGAKASTPHETMIAYCNAWFAEIEEAGFVPGVYVGARAILTGNDLFWRSTTKHYWKSGSRIPDIPHRGYQLIQSIIRNDKIDGVAIDRNLTKNDNFGGSVQWLSAS